MHLWTLVRGQVSRTALANPLPPSVTTTSGAGIGDMRADHALEFSDLAMYQETTLWIGNTYLDDSGRDSPASLNSTGDM